jgi:hypothetical protein
LYVTGLLLCEVVQTQYVQPLNGSVIFLKEANLILTDDEWRVILNVNLSTYQDVVYVIKNDFFMIEKQKQEFTPIIELKQFETYLKMLEDKLQEFHQVLPRSDRRRSLLNFGGAILKTIFGTATISDVHTLQDVFTELRSQISDMSHSLSSQITYVKKLDTIMKLDTEAIGNLSKILRDDMIQAHDKFEQLASEILWLNVTFLGQSKLRAVIRQLEFTLLQLVQQVNELLDAMQLAIQGTLSIKLVNPVTLQSILRNVTLHLPHNYELIAGTNVQNLHLYYSLAKVSVIANAHCVSIVLSIPLKSANRYFSLFRIMTLPTYVAPDKFVQIQTMYILVYNAVNEATSCFQKPMLTVAKEATLQYVRQIRRI